VRGAALAWPENGPEESMRCSVTININGQPRQADVEPRLLLVHFLRDAGLTGTKVGCDTSQCGACTVLMDGLAVKSCTTLAVQADGASVTTIEGLSRDGRLTALQEAFWNTHGLQCGFCTPGMVFAAHEILRVNPEPSADQIRHGLDGNMCRCTGYQNIVRAVLEAARTHAVPQGEPR
jgi:carbon-monoxide dehydrogenase small subunit